MEDIIINKDNQKFNYRVAILPYNNNNQVLLQKVENEEYLSLIGGRVKLGESTINALIREVQEELGFRINQKKLNLVYICENFFRIKDKDIHELLFIYKYNLDSNISYRITDKENVVAEWYEIENLKNFNIKPTIIKDFNLYKKIQHLIIGD